MPHQQANDEQGCISCLGCFTVVFAPFLIVVLIAAFLEALRYYTPTLLIILAITLVVVVVFLIGFFMLSIIRRVKMSTWVKLSTLVFGICLAIAGLSFGPGLTTAASDAWNLYKSTEFGKQAEDLQRNGRFEEQADQLRHAIVFARRAKSESLERRWLEDLRKANEQSALLNRR